MGAEGDELNCDGVLVHFFFFSLTVALGKTLINIESSRASFRTEAPPSPVTMNLSLFAARKRETQQTDSSRGQSEGEGR